MLAHLADRVPRRMRAAGRAGRTITVRVRFAGLRSVTRSLTLGGPTASTLTVTEVAERLAWSAIDDEGAEEISLLAISVGQLSDQRQLQLELELEPVDPWRPGSTAGAARWALDGATDAIRARFGSEAACYAPALLGRRRAGVPDAFRELAEHDV